LAANPVLFCNNICGNTYGVSNFDPDITVDADSNWWGDPSGPGGVGPGSGDEVSLFVNFTPWLTDSMEWLGVEEYESDNVVIAQLHVYPNPFSHTTAIRYDMRGENDKDLFISIYDISGRCVKSFHPLPYAPSPVQISWDATDDAGSTLPCGVYFLKLQGGEYSTTAKLLLVR